MEPGSNHLSADQIISAVSEASLPDLERIFDRVLAAQAARRAPHLSGAETSLLARINQSPPLNLREQLSRLRAKREDGSISDIEYEELTRLTDLAEELHAERMAAMVELAKLRGVTLPVLMNQLDIKFPEHVG
jgi:hypothetical protein